MARYRGACLINSVRDARRDPEDFAQCVGGELLPLNAYAHGSVPDHASAQSQRPRLGNAATVLGYFDIDLAHCRDRCSILGFPLRAA